MKSFLLIPLCLLSFTLAYSQAIFDSDIHLATPFGSVDSPPGEDAQNVIDQDPNTKYLDFLLIDGIGFEVNLAGTPQVASIIEIVTANDVPARDPIFFVVINMQN